MSSKIAAEDAVLFCAEHLSAEASEEFILSTIKESFQYVLTKIEDTAKENEHPAEEYDTTLTLAVYLNGTVYYGHSGDSGIIVLNINGTYEKITEQQRDENGCVYPLCFGETYWVFSSKKDVASILLATDGMFETLFPYLLQGEDIEIYVALAQYLMSNESLGFTKKNKTKIAQKMENFIDSIPGEQVSDDKTVLVVLDDELLVQKQPDDYYIIPDWTALKKKRDEEYKKKAYPHLFGNN